MERKGKVTDNVGVGDELVHYDGRIVTFLEKGQDEDGEYITLRHRMTQKGAINGSNSHPVLKETLRSSKEICDF